MDFIVQVAPDPDRSSFMSKYAQLRRGDSFVHLSSHQGDGVFGNVIYVRVGDIEKLYENIVSRGINTEEPENFPAVTIKLTEQSLGHERVFRPGS